MFTVRPGLRFLVLSLTFLMPAPALAQDAEEPRDEALVASVQAAIDAVRDEPAIHERPEPWLVEVAELQLETQPMRAEELEEYVKAWLVILESQVRKRIRIDIALSRAEGDAEREELALRSAGQQQIVLAVVGLTEAAMAALEDRGGDATEAESYISAATGQKLDLTNPKVLYAQSVAWLKSPDGGIRIGLNFAKFLGLLVAFWVLSRMLGRAVSTAVNRIPHASTLLGEFLVSGVRRTTLIIGLVIAVSALGVNITPLVAAIGAAGLVLGFALQGTLSNFASGIMILLYRPYDVGDVIQTDGLLGKVNSMTLVSTGILTPDNQVLIVPNNQIWNNVITNITGRDTRRVDLVFGIGYGDDIAQAAKILEETMARHTDVLEDPAPIVRVHELGDNSVNLIARPWVKTEDYWEVYWDLMRQVKESFDEAGINIPFPQRDLHVPGTIEVKLAGSGRDHAVAALGASGIGTNPD